MKTSSPAQQLVRVRSIALALPEVSERPSHGAPTWFAGKRVFATFWNDHHGDGHVAVLIPAPPGVQEMLIAQDPNTYYRPPYVGVKGWVGVEVGRISDATLRFHVETAWEMVAPKSAVRTLEAPTGASASSRKTRRAPARKSARMESVKKK